MIPSTSSSSRHERGSRNSNCNCLWTGFTGLTGLLLFNPVNPVNPVQRQLQLLFRLPRSWREEELVLGIMGAFRRLSTGYERPAQDSDHVQHRPAREFVPV